MSAPLSLAPEPQSVRRARMWVVDELGRLGRGDLADAAELGVSELVTNAILHADSPISVRLRGTKQHPRVEVRDNSQRPPTLNSDMTDEDHLLLTVGRGLGIVALYSATWGAETFPDGKIVWFEPALEPDPEMGLEADVFDLDEALDAKMAGIDRPSSLLTVRLLGMPVPLFADFRDWYAEIRRELRILSLSHADDYPLAGEVAEVTMLVEQDRRLASGVERLDQAIARGEDSVDLEYHVPGTAPDTMARMSDMLDRVDRFCREQRLLTNAAPEHLPQLWHWYTSEFSRQADGQDPRRWPGSRADEPSG